MQTNTSSHKHPIPEVETPFHCTTTVQLRYTDYDMHQHVNNNAYFTFFDLAKVDYFTKVGNNRFDIDHRSLVIANINVNFFSPAMLAEPIQVLTQCVKVGDKSLTLVQQVCNAHTGEVKCMATTVLVHFDPATATPLTIPDHWRNAFDEFESRPLTPTQS